MLETIVRSADETSRAYQLIRFRCFRAGRTSTTRGRIGVDRFSPKCSRYRRISTRTGVGLPANGIDTCRSPTRFVWKTRVCALWEWSAIAEHRIRRIATDNHFLSGWSLSEATCGKRVNNTTARATITFSKLTKLLNMSLKTYNVDFPSA